jgi:DNA-binding beta-propeller fold protein YncE
MFTRTRAALVLGVIVLVVTWPPAEAGGFAPPARIMILDGESAGTYHDWRRTTPLLEKVLEETGLFDVTVVTAPAATGELTSFRPDFASFRAVVLNYDAPDDRWPGALKSSLEQYVTSGGGLVIVHAADNAFAGWPAFNEMIGVGGWRGRTENAGPYWYYKGDELVSDRTAGSAGSHGQRLPFQLTARNPTHPIMRGLPSAWMHHGDELYARLRGPGKNMTVLATAYSDPANNGSGFHEPQLMVLAHGQGRIFHTTLGHDVDAMSSVDFVVTLQRGTEWAATGDVTQRVPTTFPTAETVTYRADLRRHSAPPAPAPPSDAPAITHTAVDTLAKGQEFVVEAVVNGPRPIARVHLAFQLADRFGDVALTRAGTSTTWRARVPGARLDRDFTYIIHAIDEGGRVTTWPATPGGHRVAVRDVGKPNATLAADRHLLYVAVPGVRNYAEFGGVGVLVFDIANGHKLVKRIPTLDAPAGQAPENVKGVALNAHTNVLYVTTPRRMFALDLNTERLVWNREYDGGCDRMALSPDGTIIYLPSLEGPHWHAVDARTGDVIAKIQTDSGAHNTIYGADGKEVYLAGLTSRLLHVADPRTHTVAKRVGPFSDVIRPFTVNNAQTLCFVNVNGLLGFEIGDLRTGKMLHRIEVQGYKQGPVKRHSCPSHGVGLTPDESEIWVVDAANNSVHIFGNDVMPPRQLTSIRLRDQPGWITFSIDGRYAYPSTGEVIDVKTRKIVTALTDEQGRAVQSEKMVEAIYRGGRLVRAGDQFGVGRK